jgi:hypothetical protein
MARVCSRCGIEVHTWFWWGNMREGGHLENSGVDWDDNIKMDLRKVEWGHELD